MEIYGKLHLRQIHLSGLVISLVTSTYFQRRNQPPVSWIFFAPHELFYIPTVVVQGLLRCLYLIVYLTAWLQIR